MAKATALAIVSPPRIRTIRTSSKRLFRVYTLASAINETINNELSLQFAHKALRIVERSVELDAADVQAKQNLAKAYARLGTTLRIWKGFPNPFRPLKSPKKSPSKFLNGSPQTGVTNTI